MTYSIAKLKTFQGMEGEGYNCDLLLDGNKIAFCIDDACGGPVHVQWTDRMAAPAFDAFLEEIYGPDQMEADGCWVGRQVNIVSNVTRTSRLTGSQVLFITEVGSTDIFQIKRDKRYPISAYVDHIMKKHGHGAIVLNTLTPAAKKAIITASVIADVDEAEAETQAMIDKYKLIRAAK